MTVELKRRLHRLVRVYTCQNATLLGITCHGSIISLNRENVKCDKWFGSSVSPLFAKVYNQQMTKVATSKERVNWQGKKA